MADFFWTGTRDGVHGSDYNWNNYLNWGPLTGPPGSGDDVTIEGFYAGLGGDYAIVDGAGAANSMMLEGPVEFQSGFDVTVGTDASLTEGGVLTVDPGAQWQVSGNFTLLNTYNSGFGVDLDAYGNVGIAGTLAVSWGSLVQLYSGATVSVGAIAPASGVSPGQSSLSLLIAGSFVDYGNYATGGGAAIIASGNGAVLIGGQATLSSASIQAQDSGSVALQSIASGSNAEFIVGSSTAGIAVGSATATAGEFDLEGSVAMSGAITAPNIIINGTLEVNSGQSETLSGTLAGGGSLQIDSNAKLYVNDEPAASGAADITFNGAGGYLIQGPLADDPDGVDILSSQIENFATGDVIDLTGFTNAKIDEEEGAPGDLVVTLSGQLDGQPEYYVLGIAGPMQGQLEVTPESDFNGNDGTTIQYANTGDDYDWTGGGGTNDWSDAGNWDDLTTDQPATEAPGAADNAVFGELAGGSATVGGTGEANGIALGTTVEFVNGADITAEVAAENTGGNTTIDSGATLTVSDYFNAESNASLTIGGTMSVGGDLQQVSDDSLTIDSGASLSVGADFNAASASNVTLTINGAMTVDGQFLEADDATTTVASHASLTVSSDFVAGSDGTLTVAGSMTIDGQLTQASGQTIVVSGALNVAAIEVGGSVSGDTYNISGGYFQDAGDFSSDGDTIHILPGQFNITGTSTLTGDYLTIGSNGSFNTADGTLSGNSIYDTGSGVIDVTGNLSSDGDNINLTYSMFTVSGTATVTNDPTFSIGDQASFSAQDAAFSGNDISDSGSIDVTGNLSSTGDTINLLSGSSEASFTVGGTVSLTSDTSVTIGDNSTFSAQDAILSGNTITVDGSIAIAGNLSSTGDAITVNGTISGDPSGDGSEPSFTVEGTVTLTNDTDVAVADGGTFSAQDATFSGNTITASGSIDIAGDLFSTGDTIDVIGDPSGASFTVGGTATLGGAMMYVSNATVTLGSIGYVTDTSDQQDNNFQINDSSSWIEIGSAGAAEGGSLGGDFIVDSGQIFSGGGQIAAFGIVINGTLEVQSGDQEQFISPLSGDGTVQIDAGGTAQLDTAEASGGVPTIAFNGSGGQLTLWPESLASNSIASTIEGFTTGDQIDVQDLSNDSVTYSVDGNGNLVATVGGVDRLTFMGTALEGDLSAIPDSSGGAFVEASVACFRGGTRLRTPGGEVAVERLRVGDRVVTISGEERPIRWIGQRTVNCRLHPDPRQVRPIRVAAGALGQHGPVRDLFLSPDHAVLVGGALIPIKYLANDTTIAQLPVDAVTYYHVELDQHDIVSADGLPCESYLDVGDRANFSNGGDVMRLFPDLSNRPPSMAFAWETRGYAPLVVTGPELAAARVMLNMHAARQAG